MSDTARRGRAAVTGLAVVAVGVAGCSHHSARNAGSRPGSRQRAVAGHAPNGRSTASGPGGLAAAESGLLPWRLPDPLSREVVAPGRPGQFVVLGGLTSRDTSTANVYTVTVATGKVRSAGALAAPVHDAAVGAARGQALVLGGGSTASTSRVQSFPLNGTGSGGGRTGARGGDAGSLPAPRSDASAVTIGGTTYVVGGYDGTRPDAAVLSTTDGRTFATVASLPVPVRYAAVGAVGGRILVFGGQAVTGPHTGVPVNVIQEVDPARHMAVIDGRLPEPLAGAAAVTVDGELLVAGGDTTGGHGPRTVATIWAYDPATRRLLRAGQLQVPVSHAGVTTEGGAAWLVGGESGGESGGQSSSQSSSQSGKQSGGQSGADSSGTPVSAVQMIRPNRAFGTAGAAGAGSPYFGGKLLVADRGNNRMLLLDPAGQVVWRYPSGAAPRLYFPDDAFFIDHGTAIISNQEERETIIKLAFPSGKIIWSYGHPDQVGTARGYLHEPDDAYLLKNGQISVADAQNCRVLVINPNGTVAHQIGTDGVCAHNPPSSMGSPNGDTPLADGNLLVSEINGSWVSEYTPAGKLAWTVQLPVIGYPSDPQQIGPDKYLIADYARPGQIVEFNRRGQILYRYHPSSGPGELDHPSLVELLPSGVFMANDDYNDRMVAIDPATGAVVWQYGVTGQAGRGPGRLNTPDGFDLLMPGGKTPTHPATG